MSEIKLFKRPERKSIFLRTFDPAKINTAGKIHADHSQLVEQVRKLRLDAVVEGFGGQNE